MKKAQPAAPRSSSILLSIGQASAVRRYVDTILGLSLALGPGLDRYTLTGTDDALAVLGETIAADWPASGYRYDSDLFPARRYVYERIEVALSVPSSSR